MSYWFFFSYAHADEDMFLGTFYKNLETEVFRLTGDTGSGFIDRTGIEHGANWESTLEQALQACRVFVPIYSPSYFRSEYCGKELSVFRDRLRAHVKPPAAALDPLILPVLLVPENFVKPKLPSTISSIQYKHGAYPPEYAQEGLLQMVRMGSSSTSLYFNQYWTFLRALAATLVTAGNTHPLPAATSITPLAAVNSVFSPAGTLAKTAASEIGPRYVQFIFVAGNQTELGSARSELKFYGQKGGGDWQPYLDTHKDCIAAIATSAVMETAADMFYEEVPFGGTLITDIGAADNQNKLVVVIVDTWTLRIQSYNQLIAPLDQLSSVNCLTFVLWNDDDTEASVQKSALEATVEATFNTKIAQNDPNFFSANIKSCETFRTELIRALAKAQAKVLDRAKVRKKLAYSLVKAPFENKPSL